jgi:spermidine synthase
VGEVLFTDEFYANCARILTARGLVVNQCGVPFMQADELRETSARRRKFFPHVSAYVASVPTYVGGLMTLGIAAKSGDIGTQSVEEITARAEAAGVLGTTEYWTPDIHVGSFHLPPYIARHLKT